MKKTTIFAVILSGLNLANAAEFTPKLEGMINFEAGTRNQTQYYDTSDLISKNNKSIKMKTGVNVGLKLEAKTDDSPITKYGAVIKLRSNVDDNLTSKSRAIDKTYIFLQSEFGKLEVGNNYSAGDILHLSADNTNCDWKSIANLTMNYNDPTSTATPPAQIKEFFLEKSSLYSDIHSSINRTNEGKRKVTFYSPKYNHFQFGVSYIPDLSNYGDAEGANDKIGSPFRRAKNVFNGGARYENKINEDLSVKLSLVADYANSKIDQSSSETLVSPRKALFSYSSGIRVNYKDFEFGYAYSNLGKSLIDKTYANLNINPYSHTFGLSYDVNEKLNVGVTYFTSRISATVNQAAIPDPLNPNNAQANRSFEYYAIGAENKVTEGVSIYGDIVKFRQRTTNPLVTNQKNSGFIFGVGTQLSFF